MSDDDPLKKICDAADEMKKLQDALCGPTERLREALGGGETLRSYLEDIRPLPLPREDRYPIVDPSTFRIPDPEEQHEYESSRVLLERLAARLHAWREELPQDAQTVVLAILPSGAVMRVHTLAQEGHNGVAVRGMFDNRECLLLAHQASLQLLCVVEPVTAEEKRRPIGFQIGGRTFEE